MHGDLVNKHKAGRAKERRGLARAKMTGETPPSDGARQALKLAMLGFLGVLAGVCVWLGAVSNGLLLGILIVIWVGSVPCAGLAVWRGKFERDSIERGHSPVRGMTFAKVGFFGGSAALLLDVVVLVLAIVAATGGGEEVVPQDAGARIALEKFANSIIDDDYATYKSMLSAAQLEVPGNVKDEEFENNLKRKFDERRNEEYAAMKVESVKIDPIDENKARGTLFLRGTKDQNRSVRLTYTLVKEDGEWKVGR